MPAMFPFDSDHLSIMQRRKQPEYARLSSKLVRYPEKVFFTPIIGFHEQASGWIGYINNAGDATGRIRGYRMLEHLISDYATSQIAHFNAATSAIFDLLRAQRVRVGTMDLRIAAMALSNDFTLLSRNLVDFRQVPNLKVEDWTT